MDNTNKLKVLHIGKYYYPSIGGIESVTKDLCEGMSGDRVHVEVLCSNDKNQKEIDRVNGIKVTRLPRFGLLFRQPLNLSLFLYYKFISSFDVIHIHSPNPLIEFFCLFLPRNKKIVVTYHSDIVKQKFLKHLYAPIFHLFLKRVNTIYAATENHIKHSVFLPDYRKKCELIPFGLDLNNFVDQDGETEQREKLIKDYGRYILFIGRLVDYKGLEYLISAMEKVDAKLLICGHGPDREDLEQLSKDLDLQEKIIFLGRVKDDSQFQALYKGCQFFVLPSISPNENFGVVQLEAMYYEKPVITTKLNSGVPCVGNEQTTLLVEPKNINELQTAINSLLDDPERCKEMGRAGKKRVLEMYTLEKMINKTVESYYSL